MIITGRLQKEVMDKEDSDDDSNSSFCPKDKKYSHKRYPTTEKKKSIIISQGIKMNSPNGQFSTHVLSSQQKQKFWTELIPMPMLIENTKRT